MPEGFPEPGGRKTKKVVNHGKVYLEDKNYSAVDYYGSGNVGPPCVGFYGAGRCGANLGDADGRGNARIYGARLAGSLDHGCTCP